MGGTAVARSLLITVGGKSRKTPAGKKHPLAQSYEKSNLTVLVMFCMVSSYLKNVVGLCEVINSSDCMRAGPAVTLLQFRETCYYPRSLYYSPACPSSSNKHRQWTSLRDVLLYKVTSLSCTPKVNGITGSKT